MLQYDKPADDRTRPGPRLSAKRSTSHSGILSSTAQMQNLNTILKTGSTFDCT